MPFIKKLPVLFFFALYGFRATAQLFMTHVNGRNTISLNGKWNVIIDPYDIGSGNWQAYYKDRKAKDNRDFVEYSFDDGPALNVPGDFNSQMPELHYYESSVWYKKTFRYTKSTKRLFIYFGAVNYKAEVYVNHIKVGTHEGGFTPFQFELTNYVKDGENSVIVKTNNARIKNGIPGLGFDWFNYGGITRDVALIETPAVFIEDYLVQLKKNNPKLISGYIQLNGKNAVQKITLQIPELKINKQLTTNNEGLVQFDLTANPIRWSPENPKTYEVKIRSETDTITEAIGFRNLQVKGTEILLNGKPVFLKGVNIHEEIPQRKSRAYSEADALELLNWAKELGCNFVRLAHYPHNEYTIKMAEKMGIMVWEEIPVYQGIDFADTAIQAKMHRMVQEMIERDKNRCNVIIWSMANETSPTRERNEALTDLIKKARLLDSTRLITLATNNLTYHGDSVHIKDSICALLDVMAVNEYLGWYVKWPKVPGAVTWTSDFNKPLIMSEFGGEALYGNDAARKDSANTWSEDYQAQIFKDQFKMLKNIPFLRGTCPWILVDFQSPTRNQPKYQNGWNRKGLLSDRGDKKKAWYIVHAFYTGL